MSFSSANNDSPSGAAYFMLAAIVSGYLLLILSLIAPNTVGPIARVIPPLVLLPAILLLTSCALWLQAWIMPMLIPQRNPRGGRIPDTLYNALGEDLRPPARRSAYPTRGPREMTTALKAGLLFGSLALACVVWLCCLSYLLQPRMQDYVWDNKGGGNERPRVLAKAQMAIWIDPTLRNNLITHQRYRNPEWDFKSRTFLVLALANVALRDPVLKPSALSVIDSILTETLEQERRYGQEVFFVPGQQSRRAEFLNSTKRSVMVDGELAMMLGARRLVEEHVPWRDEMQQRVRFVAQSMREGPLLCAESYPNECSLPANALAAATLRISDVLDGTDYAAFIDTWIQRVRTSLVDPKSRLVVSRFDFSAKPVVLEGPEGVSVWTTVHFLHVVDRMFAQDQYDAAKQLRGSFIGFGYSREWPTLSDYPPTQLQQQAAESEGIVPILQASPDSSGRALVAAQTFADVRALRSLITSLEFFGFPTVREGRPRYITGSNTGDAVILYAFVQGPLWEKVRAMAPKRGPDRGPEVPANPAPTSPQRPNSTTASVSNGSAL